MEFFSPCLYPDAFRVFAAPSFASWKTSFKVPPSPVGSLAIYHLLNPRGDSMVLRPPFRSYAMSPVRQVLPPFEFPYFAVPPPPPLSLAPFKAPRKERPSPLRPNDVQEFDRICPPLYCGRFVRFE